MHFYPFNIGDYLSHTSHLSDAEDLAYRRMLDLYYQTEQPFENAERVARKIRSKPEIVQAILEEFFTLATIDSCWHHSRADDEIEKYRSLLEKSSKGGRASAQRRAHLKDTSTTLEPPLNHPSILVEANKKHETRNNNQETINNITTLSNNNNRDVFEKPKMIHSFDHLDYGESGKL
jgi:uncharacterized protein YdaU (DUF1376 family)